MAHPQDSDCLSLWFYWKKAGAPGVDNSGGSLDVILEMGIGGKGAVNQGKAGKIVSYNNMQREAHAFEDSGWNIADILALEGDNIL